VKENLFLVMQDVLAELPDLMRIDAYHVGGHGYFCAFCRATGSSAIDPIPHRDDCRGKFLQRWQAGDE
jgi:hypothetical protein